MKLLQAMLADTVVRYGYVTIRMDECERERFSRDFVHELSYPKGSNQAEKLLQRRRRPRCQF